MGTFNKIDDFLKIDKLNSFFLFDCIPGVNMKCAILEGSNMAGVNLRVGTIKYANLQNCTLRGAVLAGADLEVKWII